MIRKMLIKLLFYILFLLTTINTSGQYAKFEFDHYTINDGLSNGYITAIFQDSKGFMWIGTANGLNRFDGLSFKSYFFDPKDTTSLSGSSVTYCTEDTLGKIWMMTNKNLCVYDRKKDHFTRKQLIVNGKKIETLITTTSFIDKKGFLWIGSYSGIYKFKLYGNPDIYNNVIEAEAYLLDDEIKNPNKVNSFIEDKTDTIWAVGYSNKLFYFNHHLNKFIPRAINHPEINKLHNKEKGMIMDRDGDIFITVEQVGLLVWERNKNVFSLYQYSNSNNGNGPNGDIPFALAEDKNGNMWIGERNKGGINIFNKKTKKFTYCLNDESDPHSLISNKISVVYCDQSGSMWIGANVGVDRYNASKIKFNRYFSSTTKPDKLSFNNTLCFAEDKNNDIWIGTDGGGLNKLDRKTGKFTHYKHDPSNPNSISSNSIISIAEDHDGILWIGTFNGGLVKMEHNKFSSFKPNPSDPYSVAQIHVWYAMGDSKKNLWIGTLSNGIELFDRKTKRFYQYVAKGDSSGLLNNAILKIYEDSRHILYVTTYQGISIIDLNATDFTKTPPDIKFHHLLHNDHKNSISSDAVYCVAEDRENNLWFGTFATGMDKLDRATGKFTNYSTKDGLPGNAVTSILFDRAGNLWIATDKGLAKFNPKTKEVHVFDQQDGLLNQSLKGWAIKTRDGEMFFGGPDGFNSFYPDKITYNTSIPPVVITGLKIFNQPVKVDEKVNDRIILTNDISETDKLVLTYNENFLTFNFIALDYTSPAKNQYAYILEGIDKDWIRCGTKREANYTNLDPGKYILRVKASNNDGVWNQTGTSLTIIILPPWWKTWWFKLFAFGIFTSAIYLIFYLRIDAYRKKQNELTVLVKQRTMEISQANEILLERQTRIEEYADELQHQTESLKETNNLLLDKQKLIKSQADQLKHTNQQLNNTNQQLSVLNSTKDRFFSIIAHDLRNPFHTVSGFAEILIRDYKTLPSEKTERFLHLIYNSSTNGNKLLENLLQWSRSQTGRITFEPANLNLSALVEEVMNLLEADALVKSITFNSQVNENVTIWADENMVKTVLRNLISNAIKFTPNNGLITIKANSLQNQVEVTVEDNGVGIPADTIPLLFQIEKTITTKGTAQETGTGLGLLLCKEFIEKHNGKIWVESEVGKGSKFRFTLLLS